MTLVEEMNSDNSHWIHERSILLQETIEMLLDKLKTFFEEEKKVSPIVTQSQIGRNWFESESIICYEFHES